MRYIIPKEWIDYLEDRILVTHDSLLPRYRGFAQLVSALINGDKETGLTVMLAGEEMDAGEIVYQKSIQINTDYTINDLIKAIIAPFNEGIIYSLNNLISGKIKREKQDNFKATYSIWRNENDLLLDWNESSSTIERKIRALGYPYIGARTSLYG